MVEKEEAKTNISLVDYEFSREEHGGVDLECEVSQKCIAH